MVDENDNNNAPGLDEDKPKWALELTQAKLLGELKKLTDLSKDEKKTVEKLADSIEKSLDKTEDFQKSVEKDISSMATSLDTFFTGTFLTEMNRSTNAIVTGMNKMQSGLHADVLSMGDVSGGTSSPDLVGSLGKANNDFLKKFQEKPKSKSNDGGDDLTDKSAKNNLLAGSAAEALSNMGSAFKGTAMPLSTMSGAVNTLGGGLSSAAGMIATQFPIAGQALQVFTVALAAAAGIIQQQYGVWQSVAQVGQTFAGDMFKMSATVYGAGLTLEEGAKLIKNHSQLSASVGVQHLLDVQKETRRLTKGLSHFGLEVEMIADITATYMETRLALGTFEKMTAKEEAKKTKNYIKNLSVLSGLTGKSIEAINKQKQAYMENADALGAVAGVTERMGAKAGKNFSKSMDYMTTFAASMPGTIGDMMMEQVNNVGKWGTAAVGEFGRISAIMGGDVAKLGKKLESAMVSGDEGAIQKASAEYIIGLKNTSNADMQRLNAMAENGDAAAKAQISAIGDARKTFGDLKSVADVTAKMKLLGDQAEDDAQRNKAMAEIGETWRKAMGDLAIMIQGPLSSVFEVLTGAFNSLNDSGAIPMIMNALGSLAEALGAVFSLVWVAIAPFAKVLGMTLSVLGAVIIPLIDGVTMLAKAFESIIHFFRNMISKLVDFLAGIPIIGKAFKGASDVINQTKDNYKKGKKKINSALDDNNDKERRKDEEKAEKRRKKKEDRIAKREAEERKAEEEAEKRRKKREENKKKKEAAEAEAIKIKKAELKEKKEGGDGEKKEGGGILGFMKKMVMGAVNAHPLVQVGKAAYGMAKNHQSKSTKDGIKDQRMREGGEIQPIAAGEFMKNNGGIKALFNGKLQEEIARRKAGNMTGVDKEKPSTSDKDDKETTTVEKPADTNALLAELKVSSTRTNELLAIIAGLNESTAKSAKRSEPNAFGSTSDINS